MVITCSFVFYLQSVARRAFEEPRETRADRARRATRAWPVRWALGGWTVNRACLDRSNAGTTVASSFLVAPLNTVYIIFLFSVPQESGHGAPPCGNPGSDAFDRGAAEGPSSELLLPGRR